jgi:hypothetical protein
VRPAPGCGKAALWAAAALLVAAALWSAVIVMYDMAMRVHW